MKPLRSEWWLVQWRDAETDNGWEIDENVSITKQPATSVGVIVREDDTFLVLAADVGRCGSSRQTNRRIEIPKENIIRRIRLVQSRKGRNA